MSHTSSSIPITSPEVRLSDEGFNEAVRWTFVEGNKTGRTKVGKFRSKQVPEIDLGQFACLNEDKEEERNEEDEEICLMLLWMIKV